MSGSVHGGEIVRKMADRREASTTSSFAGLTKPSYRSRAHLCSQRRGQGLWREEGTSFRRHQGRVVKCCSGSPNHEKHRHSLLYALETKACSHDWIIIEIYNWGHRRSEGIDEGERVHPFYVGDVGPYNRVLTLGVHPEGALVIICGVTQVEP